MILNVWELTREALTMTLKKVNLKKKLKRKKISKKFRYRKKILCMGKDHCKNYGNSFAIHQTNFAILRFLISLLSSALRLRGFFYKQQLFHLLFYQMRQ